MKRVHRPGVVLHLCAEELVRLGAKCTDNAVIAVKDNHFFLCIEVDAQGSMWTPLFSDPGNGRKIIQSEHKHGHQKWIAGNTYYNPLQLWEASHKAIHSAAKKAQDKSSRNAPNTVAAAAIPDRNEFPEFPA